MTADRDDLGEVGAQRHLFLDDLLIDETFAVARTMYEPVTYEGSLMLRREMPSEGGHPTVERDEPWEGT